MTALIAWPTLIFKMEERSTNRWQHRLKRERPTCTERKSLTQSADGRVATGPTRLGRRSDEQPKINLTPTGLLMEGDYTHNHPHHGL